MKKSLRLRKDNGIAKEIQKYQQETKEIIDSALSSTLPTTSFISCIAAEMESILLVMVFMSCRP